MLSSLLLNILSQSNPITSAKPFLRFAVKISTSNYIKTNIRLHESPEIQYHCAFRQEFEPESTALGFDLPVQLVVGHKVDVLDPEGSLMHLASAKDFNLFSDVTGMESPSGFRSSILV